MTWLVQCGICRLGFDLAAQKKTLRAREGYWVCSAACRKILDQGRIEVANRPPEVKIIQGSLFG